MPTKFFFKNQPFRVGFLFVGFGGGKSSDKELVFGLFGLAHFS